MTSPLPPRALRGAVLAQVHAAGALREADLARLFPHYPATEIAQAVTWLAQAHLIARTERPASLRVRVREGVAWESWVVAIPRCDACLVAAWRRAIAGEPPEVSA